MDWRFSSGGHRWRRGIGAAISRRLATEGHDGVITHVRDRDAAKKIADHERHTGNAPSSCRSIRPRSPRSSTSLTRQRPGIFRRQE